MSLDRTSGIGTGFDGLSLIGWLGLGSGLWIGIGPSKTAAGLSFESSA